MENKIDNYIKVCPDPVNFILENDINNLKILFENLSNEMSKLKQIVKQQKERIDILENDAKNKNIFDKLFQKQKMDDLII